MVHYYPYDPSSPVAIVGEEHIIVDGKIRLRHIPAEHSIAIGNFVEVESPAALRQNQFACLYSRETGYRESSRIIYFNTAHNGEVIVVNYSAVGTVVTADDMNEIKAHLDESAQRDALNTIAHQQFANDIATLQTALSALATVQNYKLPTASATTKGGVKIGSGLQMMGEVLFVPVATDAAIADMLDSVFN